jgi:prevent-host-death family protein
VTQVGIREARAKLSQLVRRAENGEDIVIARNGRPAARLVPVATANALSSVHGALRGRIEIAEDFDDLPEDIAEAFAPTGSRLRCRRSR